MPTPSARPSEFAETIVDALLTLGRIQTRMFAAMLNGTYTGNIDHYRDPQPKRLPTTADTPVVDACSSRFLDVEHPDGTRIAHCNGRLHEHGGIKHSMDHSLGGLLWWDAGAMPAEQPCDKRCARCVERTRNAVLDAAIEWSDGGNDSYVITGNLEDAIDAYRKVMGL